MPSIVAGGRHSRRTKCGPGSLTSPGPQGKRLTEEPSPCPSCTPPPDRSSRPEGPSASASPGPAASERPYTAADAVWAANLNATADPAHDEVRDRFERMTLSPAEYRGLRDADRWFHSTDRMIDVLAEDAAQQARYEAGYRAF